MRGRRDATSPRLRRYDLYDTCQAILSAQVMGGPAQQSQRLQEGGYGSRAQNRRDPSRHLAGWNRDQMDKGASNLKLSKPA